MVVSGLGASGMSGVAGMRQSPAAGGGMAHFGGDPDSSTLGFLLGATDERKRRLCLRVVYVSGCCLLDVREALSTSTEWP